MTYEIFLFMVLGALFTAAWKLLYSLFITSRDRWQSDDLYVLPQLQERQDSSVSSKYDSSSTFHLEKAQYLRSVPIPRVTFDPTDGEHRRALKMLMKSPQKLHPSLRFNFDPAVYDNAYIAMLCTFASFHLQGVESTSTT
jgi:hypothetical protein